MTRESAAARIASVARTILIEEGADAVTMRRVAAAAGVTPMATYKHFPNREALLRTVADASFLELFGEWGKRVPAGDIRERFNGLLEDFLDFALGSPHLYLFLLTDRREAARRFPEDFRGGASPAFAPVADLVEEGMRDGFLRPDDPLEVTVTITAHTQGLVQLYLGGRIGLSESDFRALCRRTTWRIFDGIKA